MEPAQQLALSTDVILLPSVTGESSGDSAQKRNLLKAARRYNDS